MRRLDLALLMTLLVSSTLEAQFREDIEVKLVEIDVVVTDRDGKHVHGLKAEDFVVLESDHPRKITNFTEYAPEQRALAGTVDAVAAGATAIITTQNPPKRPQNLLILLDRLPRAYFIRAGTFERLEALLDKLMRDGDRLSIVSWSSELERAESVLASTDRESVRHALRTIAGLESTGGRARSVTDLAGVEERFLEETQEVGGITDVAAQQRSSEYFRGVAGSMAFHRKIREMKRLVRSLAAGPGKKTVLYVSSGFGIPSGIPVSVSKEPPSSGWDHLSGLAAVEDLVRTANAGSVTFYAVCPGVNDEAKAFGGHVDDMTGLQNLTLPTGGLYDFGVGAINTIGAALTDDVSSYYSIAYQTAGAGSDREHKIRVNTKNRQYRVRARETFVDKSKETEARDALLAGFFGGRLPDDVEFSLAVAGPRKQRGSHSIAPVVVTIPSAQLVFAREGPDRVALVRVLIGSSNGADVAPIKESDLRVVAGRDDPGGVVKHFFEVTAGFGDLSIGVLDRRNGHVGVQRIENHR